MSAVTIGCSPTDRWMDPRCTALNSRRGSSLDELLAGLPQQAGKITGRVIWLAEVATLVIQFCSPIASSLLGADYLIEGAVVAETA